MDGICSRAGQSDSIRHGWSGVNGEVRQGWEGKGTLQSTTQPVTSPIPSLPQPSMIITQPPDAKLPSLLYPSFASSSSDPFAHSDDRLVAASEITYPPTQRHSITDPDLPPAYLERPPSIQRSKPPPRKRLKRPVRITIAIVLFIYVAATLILLILYLVCHRATRSLLLLL